VPPGPLFAHLQNEYMSHTPSAGRSSNLPPVLLNMPRLRKWSRCHLVVVVIASEGISLRNWKPLPTLPFYHHYHFTTTTILCQMEDEAAVENGKIEMAMQSFHTISLCPVSLSFCVSLSLYLCVSLSLCLSCSVCESFLWILMITAGCAKCSLECSCTGASVYLDQSKKTRYNNLFMMWSPEHLDKSPLGMVQ